MRQELYVHFRPDERPFVDRALDWVERAAGRHREIVTDFLDPRQQFILRSIAGREPDVAMRLDGGWPDAERKRAVIVPAYRDPEDVDAGIVVLAVEASGGRFIQLDHGDYLGALLGLGIKRDVIGDLHVREDGCHCLVTAEMAGYLQANLTQVNRVPVRTAVLPLEALRVVEPELEVSVITAASLRLDGVASDAFRISRSKIAEPIRAGRCRVNWKIEDDPSARLEEGDVVSLKGFGRFKILKVEGPTRSGRLRVTVGKFV
ncbi:MAG: RNA-binding protein [Thermobacillus sp. ZCTH02-B1]|uniref:YlmH family RNA-binding protein n=1 Tax=Thermobacillus sp. ZCTH02-B1 TaxID=1858795 RepID=UPI000B57F5A5|nr:YlmH/Sll1252 family protein [Thermobacillus sp. ZCTH02-B1]OUM95917.1 MAG: RNA-binding protein [Thermobacillus sp. ZCTH02-B1]